MAYLKMVAFLGIALASLVCAAPVRNARETGKEGCGQGCQLLGDDSDILSRCVKYACRKHVFRYYMRVGKRFGSASFDPAFRHRLLQRQRQKQRQWQRLDGRSPSRPRQWRPQTTKDQQWLDNDSQKALSTIRGSVSVPRRNSFHAMNLNNLYRNLNTGLPRTRRWRKVVLPMTSSERLKNQLVMRFRRRLPLFFRRLNVKTI